MSRSKYVVLWFVTTAWFCWLFITPAQAALTDGLVAYYPFNGNANDVSGNGYNGIVQGAALAIDRFGNADSAYSFSGSNNYINISNVPIYQTVTLSAWTKNYNGIIVGFDGSYYMSIDSSGNSVIAATKAGNGCTSSWNDTITASDNLSDGLWHNIVYSKNQSNGDSFLYVDGVLKSNGNAPGYINDCSYGGYIGTLRMWDGVFNEFAVGQVDDIRIYNRALAAAEVQQIYLEGTTATNPATNITTNEAQLNGTVSPGNTDTTVTFDFGPTTSYGMSLIATPNTISANAGSTTVTANALALAPCTTYHYRVKAVNTATTYGTDQAFKTTGCPPIATTTPATNVSINGANINGTVTDNGLATSASFDFGLNANYGTSIAATPANIAAYTGTTPITATMAGLNCSTTYHYRAKAVSSAGIGYGSDQSLNTIACPPAVPTVITSSASGITANSAILNGLATPNWADTAVHFDLGPTTGYGMSVSAVPATIPATNGVTPVTASAFIFTCGTYHYRVTATNSAGTISGNDLTFTIPCAPSVPDAITNAASNITATSAILNAQIKDNGSDTSITFNFGPTSSYGTSVAATPATITAYTGATAVIANETGLTCNTSYHYQVVATNSVGTTKGTDQSFTTSACPVTTPCTASWTPQTSGITNIIGGIVWNGSQFTAVADSGVVITSPEGINWTKRNNAGTSTLNGIAWSGTQFAAVAGLYDRSLIYTSPDGITWAEHVSTGNPVLRGVVWNGSLNKLIAVGEQGAILSSGPDAATWSVAQTGKAYTLNAITSTGNLQVAVGTGGTILTSADGIAWAQSTSPISTVNLLTVIWNGTQFLAAGDKPLVLSSLDGVTWTKTDITTPANMNFYRITWNGSRYIGVGTMGLATSNDGQTWTIESTQASNLRDLAWSGSELIAIGDGGTILRYCISGQLDVTTAVSYDYSPASMPRLETYGIESRATVSNFMVNAKVFATQTGTIEPGGQLSLSLNGTLKATIYDPQLDLTFHDLQTGDTITALYSGTDKYRRSSGSVKVGDAFTLTVATNGTGIGTVKTNQTTSPDILCGGGNNNCTQQYSKTTPATVTLIATPASGSTFTGWSGDCTGTVATCTVSMTTARNVTATFTINSTPTSYTVTPIISIGGTVIPSTPQTVAANTAKSFTVVPKTGYIKNPKGVSGTCPLGHWGGNVWTTGNITANCSVNFDFLCLACIPGQSGWRTIFKAY